MNIEVGEYIRTKQGDIDKVILEYTDKCANPNCSAKHISCKLNYYDEEDIVSHSKDIIDLIERGDFVNGEYVMHISENIKAYGAKTIITECSNRYFGSQVIGIVTKQQFSNMEYKL